MAQLTPQLRFTIATPSDRPQVTRLCRRAVGSWDYVLRILPKLIARGGLFLAWDGDFLVGITNFEICLDGSGWLSVARTDPKWRGRGVATALQRQIATCARGNGVRTLRLWVLAGNKPSLRACEKGGFKQVCEAAHISCTLRATKPSPQGQAGIDDAGDGLRSILKSSYAAKMNGYIGHRRHFMKLTIPLLERLCSDEELHSILDSTMLISQPDTLFGVQQSSLALLEGPMAKSFRTAKDIARSKGARVLASYIPYDRYEISVARRLGFRRSPWGTHCMVFEKRL